MIVNDSKKDFKWYDLKKRVFSLHRMGEDLASIWTGPQDHLCRCVSEQVCVFIFVKGMSFVFVLYV